MKGREGKPRAPVARQSSFRTIAILTLAPVVALLLFFAARFLVDVVRPAADQTATATAPPVESAVIAKTVPAASPPKRQAVASRGDLVLILDDVGFDRQPLEKAMEIDRNINFAILPNAPRAAEVARSLNSGGFEILCHLPMEPVDGRNSPGDGAITTSMTEDQIVTATRDHVRSIPFARGVNNHMGSRATRDERVMRSVLGALPAGVYFVDSRTTPDSVAERIAKELKIPTAGRAVFLDDRQEEEAVRLQLDKLTQAAAASGTAVGIGHMYPVTIAVLRQEIPRLRREGWRIRRASEVVQ
ncbi:MAG TPA: divergent polysaccharide deacetylase family protein [Thermoanaerobaculia bacterium]|nr:divergent polysaccharide deacetylase family protein [Thermoanaerobaculia bacterium]